MKILKSVWYQSFLSRIFGTLLCACCLFAPAIISAADGDVDPTFKTDVTENNGTINSVVVQPDRKILVGGFFEAFGGRARRGVARLQQDGTLDLTFDAGAALPNALTAQATVRAIVVQPDGKILVGISYQSPGATPRKLIIRLNADGTLDSSFTTSLLTRPFAQDGAFAIALQADGKILVGGDFRYTGGTQRNLARLHADGSIDSSFIQPTTGIGANNVRAIAVQPDGKILCGGTGFNGPSIATTRQAFWRLNTDGSVDTDYSDPNIPSSGNINALVLQPDGSMIAVGSANFSGQTPQIMRITAIGTRDASFTDIFSAASLVQLARQTDGKIIVVGDFQITNPAIRKGIARLNADGSLDASFSTSGSTGTRRAISAVALQTDGKVIPVGAFDNFNGSPAEDYLRLNTDGSRDSSFTANSVGYNAQVTALVRQPDGKTLVGISPAFGNPTKLNGARLNGIARLNKDYSVDTTFTPPLTTASLVLHIVLQADGKILISGNLYVNQSTFSLLRLNSDGTVDATFNPPPNLSVPVVQPDGRIIVAGAGEIVRLNSNGSRDNTFTATVTGFGVTALALQTDGRILVGGIFSSINSVSRTNIARLDTDGSVDTNFNPGAGANDMVSKFLLRADGRIFIGGRFSNYNGTARNRLALLEANGSLNNSFVPVNPNSQEVFALALQADGKPIFGTQSSLANPGSLFRLNTDGAIDPSFVQGALPESGNTVNAILLQANGKIVIGGTFDTFNGLPRMCLARLNPHNQTADFDYDNRTDLSVFRPSENNWYIMQSATNQLRVVQWGLLTDKLVPANYDGDGKTDIAVWREGAQAVFYILKSSNNTVRVEQFGQTGDDPTVVGDWDGDGRADVAVYRNAAFGNQSCFFYRGSFNNPNGNITFLPWGTNGDKAVRGDFDGDERIDAAVFRTSNQTWYVQQSSSVALYALQFGLGSDKLTPADYDGDGKTDVAVFRGGVWYLLLSSTQTVSITTWGIGIDTPVPADYDGDGKTDLAIYRNGIWWILQSLTNSTSVRAFGLGNDLPIPSAYIF
jgi:uncharacterized delta-60 repeat protein